MPKITRGRKAGKKPRSMWQVLYEKVIRLHGSPEQIAGGVAIGVTFGVGPTYFVGLVAAPVVAGLFKLNVAAAMLGVLTGVPPILPLNWLASCYIGGLILGLDWKMLYANVEEMGGWAAMQASAGDLLYAYIIGNLLMTAVLTTIAYLVTLKIVQRYR